MRAVDTNIVVRYLTGDDPAQSPRARALIDGEDVWLGLTVVLETEWVLRSVFKLSPVEIASALRTLAGQPTVLVENAGVLAHALALHDGGLEFADALHVSAASAFDGFMTFDAALARQAAKLGVASIVLI
jgi:predicted nucleic-acid-binding protein